MSERTKREAWIEKERRWLVQCTDNPAHEDDTEMLHMYVDDLEETIEQLEAELKELRHE